MSKQVLPILLAALVSLECAKPVVTAVRNPSQKPPQATFERKRQCMELGWTAYQRDIQESAEVSRKMGLGTASKIWGTPHYCFNPDEETCYVEHEDTDSGSSPRGPYLLFSGTMIDVLTNEEIASYSVFRYTKERAEDTTSDMTRPQFEAKRKKLMGF